MTARAETSLSGSDDGCLVEWTVLTERAVVVPIVEGAEFRAVADDCLPASRPTVSSSPLVTAAQISMRRGMGSGVRFGYPALNPPVEGASIGMRSRPSLSRWLSTQPASETSRGSRASHVRRSRA